MLLLAFETSAKAASVALLENDKLLGESYQNTGLTHSHDHQGLAVGQAGILIAFSQQLSILRQGHGGCFGRGFKG